jgi:hypothetical protein
MRAQDRSGSSLLKHYTTRAHAHAHTHTPHIARHKKTERGEMEAGSARRMLTYAKVC